MPEDASSHQRPVSQRDIAERAGVSVMAVSRALRGKPGISKVLAEKIQTLAKEMGYIENPLVSALMRRRSRKQPVDQGLVIAWIGATTSLRRKQQFTNTFDTFAHYIAGARDEGTSRGFRLETFDDPALSPEQIRRIIKARGIEGALFGPRGNLNSSGSHWLGTEPFQIVQVGRSRHNLIHDRVVSDAFNSMRQCLTCLKETGYRKVGYVDLDGHQKRSENRWLAGYRFERDLQCVPELMLTNRRGEVIHRMLSDYLEQYAPQALVVGSRNILTHPFFSKRKIPLVALTRAGLGEDITGTQANFYQIGREAARLLIDKILGQSRKQSVSRSIVLSDEWHQGTSHLPIPKQGR